MNSPERLTDFYAAQGRAAQRYAAITLDGAQRLFHAQMEASRDVLSRSGERWRDTLARLDPARGPADWPAVMQMQMQFAIETTRTAMEGAARVCEAYVHTMQEQGRAVADAYNDAPAAAVAAAPLDAAGAAGERDNDRAAEEVGRRAAEAVSLMAGQPTGAVAAAQPSQGPAEETTQRRRTIIRP
jgi:hypothetical protein